MIYLILWIIFGLLLLVEVFFVPWYLKALWPEKCRKSLILKMICATGFVAIGAVSMHIADNFSQYAIIMFIGAIFGWIGDYFLHAKPTNLYFATGFVSFLIGHVVYIVAFVKATPRLNPGYKMFNLTEVLIIIGVVIFLLALSKLIKVKFAPKIVFYAISVYLLVITSMLVRATVLGWSYYKTGAEHGFIAFLLLTCGAVFFLLSDATLGILSFGGQKKNYTLKIFNILTYFWGQVMLASSILFINA